METLCALLIFAAVIVIIYLGGRWNTPDVDHYMGFENLRSPRKSQPSGQDDEPPKE